MHWNILSGSTVRAIGACFLLSFAVVPWGQPAWAEPTPAELAKARDAFRQGVQLEASNDWVGALAKFETVAQVRMTPAVRFHIARCQQHLGQLLEARGGYRLAAFEATQSKDPKAGEVQREASEALAEIEQKIPKLVITRGKGAEAGTVTVDGVALGEASVGKEFPLNPGAHTVEFKDSDGNVSRSVVTLAEGETRTVDLEGKAPPPVATSASASAAPPPPPPPPPPEKSNVLPWVVVGVGGASLIASTIFYLQRSSAISDLDAACVDSRCPASLEDTGNKGKTYTTLANVTLGLGLVGVGVGTYLLLTSGSKPAPAEEAPKTDSARSKPRMTVVFGGSSHSAEASLVGTF